VVNVLDECNNYIGGKDVQMSIGANPPNPAALSGTLTVQGGAAGSASFGNLSLDYEGFGYTLVATVSGPGGTFGATSSPFDETRVGNPCAGPIAACGSGCPDADADGLNDAWEAAGGIDLNGDGLVTAQYDALLPDADPNVPDIYVQYDWMGYGLNEFGCSVDDDCTILGAEHAGETCSGPAIPDFAHTCVHACATDGQCTLLGPSHIGDRCAANACEHTHDPDLLAPSALADVAESFANHGIHLHLLRGHELPHSHVLSFRKPAAFCEGADIAPGVIGDYAVNLYDLKLASFNARQDLSHHYGVFGHLSSCDTAGHCSACPVIKGSSPNFGQTGIAEESGNDFIVSLAHFVNDQGGVPDFENLGGTFMHELGHNLGLHHAGGSSAPGTACTAPYCEDGPRFKPNYLSIMNYSYQFSGILQGSAIGSDTFVTCSDDSTCPAATHCKAASGVCARLDYSNAVLPTGGNTPGSLTEDGELNELAGLGSGTADLFTFDDGQCSHRFAASEGPVDWDGDGIAGDNLNATADLNESDHPESACAVAYQVLLGHSDWGPAPGQSIFTYAFQCTAGSTSTPPGRRLQLSPAMVSNSPESPAWIENELTPELAARAHVLYAPRSVRMRLAGCSRAAMQPGVARNMRIVLPGTADFHVSDIEAGSLRFQGALAGFIEIRDIDGDGKPDLTADFPSEAIRLSPRATRARLTGWLKNSQTIVADETLCR